MEDLEPERGDQLLGVVRADALDQSGAEILLDTGGRVRVRGADAVGFELRAVILVDEPAAGGLDVFAGDR